MQDKLFVIGMYIFSGLVTALWPLLINRKQVISTTFLDVNKKLSFKVSWLEIICFLIAALLIIQISGESIVSPFVVNLGLISIASAWLSPKYEKAALLPIFFALCVSATIPWWRRQSGGLEISGLEFFAFGIITFLFTQFYRIDTPFKRSGSIKWLIPYAFLAAIMSFSTGISSNTNAFLTLWHHWGAYVGPAELLLSGATIFHDFPAQYGLGPTALIASTCGNDCWKGMYFIVGSTIFLYSVIIAALALNLSSDRWPVRLSILSLCLAICFFWSAYPPDASSPFVTPSVSGLRFLPVVVLVAYLFFLKKIEISKSRMWIAHGLWALGALWSPESAFYVTLVWWPYYLLIRRVEGDLLSRAKGFSTASMKLLFIGAGLVTIFYVVFRIIYHEGPTFYGFLAYAIHPPGPMPINWHGGIWYFLLSTVIGFLTLLILWRSQGDTLTFRRGFLLQLLSYGTFSYFLGRSHDNNLLNIMPFILLVLLHAISTANAKNLTKVSVVLIAALIGWLPLFGWQAWSENVTKGKILTFESNLLRAKMSFTNPETTSKIAERFTRVGLVSGLPEDAGRAIEFIHQNYGEPVTVLDYSSVLESSTPKNAWSAIHGPANFVFIPSQRRQEFLTKTAASLKRIGWLIVDRKYPADAWLADFDFAYERTNRLDFGSYYAIRFSPKIPIIPN